MNELCEAANYWMAAGAAGLALMTAAFGYFVGHAERCSESDIEQSELRAELAITKEQLAMHKSVADSMEREHQLMVDNAVKREQRIKRLQEANQDLAIRLHQLHQPLRAQA